MALQGAAQHFLAEVAEMSRMVNARPAREDRGDEQVWLVDRLLSRPLGEVRATSVRDLSVEDTTPAGRAQRKQYDCARKPGY